MASPKPDHTAEPDNNVFMCGTQASVRENAYTFGPFPYQRDAIAVCNDGDIMVAMDSKGCVTDMHLRVGSQFVRMPHGFESEVYLILAANTGSAGVARDAAMAMTHQVANLTTWQETVASSEMDEPDPETLDQNNAVLHHLIIEARKLTGRESPDHKSSVMTLEP